MCVFSKNAPTELGEFAVSFLSDRSHDSWCAQLCFTMSSSLQTNHPCAAQATSSSARAHRPTARKLPEPGRLAW